MDAPTIRIVIADDQRAVRAGLRMRLSLEDSIEVVGEAETAAELFDVVTATVPDVVVVDVVMPEVDGIAAAAVLRCRHPEIPVVLLSLYDDAATRAKGLAAGASAFIGKHEAEELLVATLQRVAADRS